MIAALAERYWPEARRLHPVEVVAEFERTLAVELDLMREAANAAQLKRNFAGSELLYVPEIYWDYCRQNVLTIERIVGIQSRRHRGAARRGRRHQARSPRTASRSSSRRCFVTTSFTPTCTPATSSSTSRTREAEVRRRRLRHRRHARRARQALSRREFSRVLPPRLSAASRALHVDSGWVPAGTRVDELEAAVRAVCEPIFNKPIKDISFGVVLAAPLPDGAPVQHGDPAAARAAAEDDAAIEGLGRQLYPELDLWKTAKPVLEQWMRERHDPRTRFKELVEAWPEISDDLALLPRVLHRALRRMDAEDAAVRRQQRAPSSSRSRAARRGSSSSSSARRS